MIIYFCRNIKGVKNITTKKMGRPTENPKTEVLRVRIDKDTLSKLDTCAKIKETSRSEIVRTGIHKVYEENKK